MIDFPDRIVICTKQGDWIEWEHRREPQPGDCPFGDCDCRPKLYSSADAMRARGFDPSGWWVPKP